jgi:hypothetical protein
MGLLILAGEQRLIGVDHNGIEIKSYQDWVDKRLWHQASRQGVALPSLDAVSGDPLPAVVDANRWIVHCPTCNGAEFAWKSVHLFMCATCWNGANATPYTFRPVSFPPRMKAIERVLMARPVPASRNWSPGETVSNLESENEAHGLPKGVG